MGRGELPKEPFNSLEEVVTWRDDFIGRFELKYMEYLERLHDIVPEHRKVGKPLAYLAKRVK